MSATRRTILQGLATLPMAAVPAVIPDRVAVAAIHADAGLLARAPEVDAVNAAVDASFDRCAAAETLKFSGRPSSDFAAARAAQDAANDAWSELRNGLVDMPARTVAGLKLKVRLSNPQDDPYMAASIAADILAMDEGAA